MALTDDDALQRELDAFEECVRCNRPAPATSPDEYCSDECAIAAKQEAAEIAARTNPCLRCGQKCTPPPGWPQCCQECAEALIEIGMAVWDLRLLCDPCRTASQAREGPCSRR